MKATNKVNYSELKATISQLPARVKGKFEFEVNTKNDGYPSLARFVNAKSSTLKGAVKEAAAVAEEYRDRYNADFTMIFVYMNDRYVGSVSLGDANAFRCDFGNIAGNEETNTAAGEIEWESDEKSAEEMEALGLEAFGPAAYTSEPVTTTPMIKQYEEMKKKHPDAVLLFRCGDFYECFSDDAVTASEILGITLTKRNGLAAPIYLAGFPHHALDTYLPKLVRAGKRVAICEALEDPKTTTKAVKRETSKPATESAPAAAPAPAPAAPIEGSKPTAYKIPQVKFSYTRDLNSPFGFISSSADAVEVLRKTYEDGEIDYQEFIKVIYLARNNKILGVHASTAGSGTASIFDIKGILTGALLAKAEAIILAHNHPSGNLKPSYQDDQITRDLKAGAKTLGLNLYDHVILTSESYYSYADNGKM